MYQPNYHANVARYSRQSRVGYLIATGRSALAGFFLLAIWMDSSEPSRYAEATYAILALYFVYTLVLALMKWRLDIPRASFHLVNHVIDLMVFAVVMVFTQGPSSPFFVYFTFSLVCATLRWQWRGVLWTAAISLALITSMAFYPYQVFSDPDFELNRFIIRIVYLAVVAIMLGYLGAYEHKLRTEISGLAAWPRTIPADIPALLEQTLKHAAKVLAAPRLVLIYEEADEPWVHIASWSGGKFDYTREPPSVFGDLVAELLAGTSFFCPATRTANPTVVYNLPVGLRKWHGQPLDSRLQSRFDIQAVLSLKLRAENTDGYLLAVDMHKMTSDDLTLGDIVANEVITVLEQFYLQEQLKYMAASEERIRLARDLHDSLLQSLTGIALQLETFHKIMEAEPELARERLLAIQRLIAVEQREVRSHIQALKTSVFSSPGKDTGLRTRLEELAAQIKSNWGLQVESNFKRLETPISPYLSREIYYIVHEALINAARHARASAVEVELIADEKHMRILIGDNGRGFPFHGRYDQAGLAKMNQGPVSLRERVSSLGGSLFVDSTDNGAGLEITLPLPDKEG